MKRVILGIVLMFLLFGCIDLGGDTTPTTPITNQTGNGQPATGNATNDSTIVIGTQENQTIEQNVTPPEPPKPNVTENISYNVSPNSSFAIYFIYVGELTNKIHGEAILIKKDDFEMLVDAGPSENAGKVIDFLKSRSVDDLEVVVSTNADPWHYGGLGQVASNYEIEEFWWSGKTFNDGEYSSIVDAISSKAENTTIIERGFEASYHGMDFEVLNPKTKAFEDVNNDAIVIRMDDRNFSIVLLSGVQFGAQSEMINNMKDKLQVNMMSAPYYGLGAGTSGIGNFLTSAKPETMIVSGGPDESAASGGARDPFRRLMDEHNVNYYENYKGGTIRVASDGSTYAVSYFGS
jgi:beta-lactamase superfamily II metal-dependent hydrolase